MVSPGLILSTPPMKAAIEAGDGATDDEDVVVVVGTVVVVVVVVEVVVVVVVVGASVVETAVVLVVVDVLDEVVEEATVDTDDVFVGAVVAREGGVSSGKTAGSDAIDVVTGFEVLVAIEVRTEFVWGTITELDSAIGTERRPDFIPNGHVDDFLK